MTDKTVEYPENFKTIIVDFTSDLAKTFPEYDELLNVWYNPNTQDDKYRELFQYCLTLYPERFFDFLYQNIEIFDKENEAKINTFFLPNLDFRLLFQCENISETTKKSLWKYLQLILFTLVGSMKNKDPFGETANAFEGIDEKDLYEKLNSTMEGISDFFQNMDFKKETPPQTEPNQTSNNETNDRTTFNFDKMDGMPNIENLHANLKGMFDGKIGKLAKEMAEEITNDLGGMLGEDFQNATSTDEIIKKIMKNPKKIMDIMKTVGTKLNSKMQSGDISQDEIMKEATDIMQKMKDMGGTEQFNDIMKNLAKTMGKGARVDTSAMERMTKQYATKERLRNNLNAKKEQQVKEEQEKRKKELLFPTEKENHFIYRNNEIQEKTMLKKQEEIDNQLIAELGDAVEKKQPSKSQKKKSKK
jgi:hypothetical protein